MNQNQWPIAWITFCPRPSPACPTHVHEVKPDLLVIHGDRVEALAGASVGALNNLRVCHVEGGEVSGTVDELIRHAVSKLSHIHFVANDQAPRRGCSSWASAEESTM